MDEFATSVRCRLCNTLNRLTPAQFSQIYPQKDISPLSLAWMECHACGGWFVRTVPVPESIQRHWAIVFYNDPRSEVEIAQNKRALFQNILTHLACQTEPGPLLDFGCNFGQFLSMAAQAGWSPSGFEPYSRAAEIARAKGFDVRSRWLLEEAGFPGSHFTALTAIDVFCYTWDPYKTLEDFLHLLKPGGILALRVTNKRFVLGLLRTLTPIGPARNARLSKLLQAQFHSIGLASFRKVLHNIGFVDVEIQPRAMTMRLGNASFRTLSAYLITDLLYLASMRSVNLYPGVLVFARKSGL